ncbi:hypothetical protein Q8A67_021918 [Cirrhinus molitorella]|uniref:Uncharacterized protein n=1 Tax=Cirrhinus molitorella TaxID=172907 RepID=A0AA88TDJ6_9TELE|nr:hypothetical protein Q8A67_021918 [Cirrhinus molitorella]
MLTTQACMLADHQQQLAQLTALTKDLVAALQTLQLTQPQSSTPAAPSTAPTQPAPALAASGPRLAYPEKFDGSPGKCKGACEEKAAGQRDSALGCERASACSAPACLALATEREFACPLLAPDQRPSVHASAIVSFGGSEDEALDGLGLGWSRLRLGPSGGLRSTFYGCALGLPG